MNKKSIFFTFFSIIMIAGLAMGTEYIYMDEGEAIRLDVILPQEMISFLQTDELIREIKIQEGYTFIFTVPRTARNMDDLLDLKRRLDYLEIEIKNDEARDYRTQIGIDKPETFIATDGTRVECAPKMIPSIGEYVMACSIHEVQPLPLPEPIPEDPIPIMRLPFFEWKDI